MSTLFNSQYVLTAQRSTEICKCAALNYEGIGKIVFTSESMFSDFLDFSNEITSIMFYPLENIGGDDTFTLYSSHGNSGISSKKVLSEYSWFNLDNIIKKGYEDEEGEHYAVTGTKLNIKKILDIDNNPERLFLALKGYTFIKIYLPFLGFIDLNPNDFFNSDYDELYLHIRLSINYVTGQGTYILYVSEAVTLGDDGGGKLGYTKAVGESVVPTSTKSRIIGVYGTQIGLEIPKSTTNIDDVKRTIALGIVNTSTSLIGTAITAGSMASGLPVASYSAHEVTKELNKKTGRLRTVQDVSYTTEKYSGSGATVNNIIDSVSKSTSALLNSVPHSYSDRINSSTANFMAYPSVQIFIYTPKIITKSSDYKHYYGLPYNKEVYLNTLRGFSIISGVHLEGNKFAIMTNYEENNLMQTLTSGVIFPE